MIVDILLMDLLNCICVHICIYPEICVSSAWCSSAGKRSLSLSLLSNNQRTTDVVFRHPLSRHVLFLLVSRSLSHANTPEQMFLAKSMLRSRTQSSPHRSWKGAIWSFRLTLRSDNWKETLSRHGCFLSLIESSKEKEEQQETRSKDNTRLMAFRRITML